MPASLGAAVRNHPVPWLIGLVALLYFWNLGLVELSVTDEARSGMIVRDMLSGHYLLPRTPDGYLVEKPPAYYGICALLGSVFGVNEWTLRGVSVLAALGTLAVTAWIVRLFGSPRAAWLAVVALASNYIVLSSARDAMVDMLLTFFLTVGFAGYFAGRLGRISPERATGICGLAFGLAVLTKGPVVGLALPIAVCGGEILLETRGRLWLASRILAPALGSVLLALAVAALWYLPGLILAKGEFLETSILSENFRMPLGMATGIGVSHRKPFPYYGLRQMAALLPLLPLLIAVPAWTRDPAQRTARRLLGSWALFGFLLFQAASNKRYYYLVTIQPAFAAMMGLAADHWASRKDAGRWSFPVTGIAVALAGLVCAALPFVPLKLGSGAAELAAEIPRHRGWVVASGLAVALAGSAMFHAARRGPGPMLVSAAALALVAIAVSDGLGDRFKPNRTRSFLSEALPKIPESAHPVIYPPITGYSLDFYWPKPIVRDAEAARAADYVLIEETRLLELNGPSEKLGTWRYGDSSRNVVLIRRAP
jgi:4-amino-4-deoxy-L-arabinose transferase-like glycosyltransferase